MAAHRTTWIKLHGDAFANKKIVLAAATLTHGDVEKMVGHISRLWTWAVDNADDGDLGHLSPAAIAQAAGWKRNARTFVDTLIETRLLDHGQRVHNWEEYAGRLVERRRADGDRKKAAREGKMGLDVSAGHPQEVPQSVRYPRRETEEEKKASSREGRSDETRSRLVAALVRLPGYTRDAGLEDELSRDAAIDVIIEQLAYFADRLTQPGQAALTPVTQCKRIHAWLAVAKSDLDEERSRAQERRLTSGSVEEQLRRLEERMHVPDDPAASSPHRDTRQ